MIPFQSVDPFLLIFLCGIYSLAFVIGNWIGSKLEYQHWHIHFRTASKFWTNNPREMFIRIVLTSANRPSGRIVRGTIAILEIAMIGTLWYYYHVISNAFASLTFFGFGLAPLAEIGVVGAISLIFFEASTYELYTHWLLKSYETNAGLAIIEESKLIEMKKTRLKPIVMKSAYEEHREMILKKKSGAEKRLSQIKEAGK